jgi:hypothetical protein
MKKGLLTIAGAILLTSSVFSQSADDLHAVYSDLTVFSDGLASSLKKGVGKKQINLIKNEKIKALAFDLLRGEKKKSK